MVPYWPSLASIIEFRRLHDNGCMAIAIVRQNASKSRQSSYEPDDRASVRSSIQQNIIQIRKYRRFVVHSHGLSYGNCMEPTTNSLNWTQREHTKTIWLESYTNQFFQRNHFDLHRGRKNKPKLFYIWICRWVACVCGRDSARVWVCAKCWSLVPTNGFCHTSCSTRARTRQVIYIKLFKKKRNKHFDDDFVHMYAWFRANALFRIFVKNAMRCAQCFMQNKSKCFEHKIMPDNQPKADRAYSVSVSAYWIGCWLAGAFRSFPSQKETIWIVNYASGSSVRHVAIHVSKTYVHASSELRVQLRQ